MSGLTGAGQLFRLMARLDRVRLGVWVLVLGLVPLGVASSFATLYATETSRQQLVATVATSPGLVALLGPVHGSSIGALTAWRIGTIGAVLVALMAAFTVIRHTRLEEETGRRELLGATVVGRHAPLVAATILNLAAGTIICLLITVGMIGLGEDLAGSIVFGVSWLLVALVFGAVGALTAQLTDSAGGARALAGAVVGVFFALRMAGDGGADSGIGWLSWLSPIGWVARLEAYGDERWWVVSLFVVLGGFIGGLAFGLSARRDVGAGVFPPRPGPASAAPHLSSSMGLAWRLQKGALIGWSVSIALFGVVWGGLADTIGGLLEENPQLAEIIEALGGEGALTETFFAAAMGIFALVVSVFTIDSALTLKSEEVGLKAEQVLATPTPRLRWAGSHICFAVGGPVLLMTIAGLTAGLTYGSITGDIGGQVPSLIMTALLQIPAIWVVTGLTVALYGLAPELTSAAWGALVAFLLLGQLGQILQLPQWALDLSPFTHVPSPPESVTALPLVLLGVIAAGLFGAGLSGFRHRDLI